jgi:predicted GH43/DUF377 family glycosyl hydrolase
MKVLQFLFVTTFIPLVACQTSADETDKNLKIQVDAVPAKAILQEEGYNVWGASMARTNDGICHLYYARWPSDSTFRGWLKYSEIAYATSSQPTGPYQFQRVILKGFGKGNWNEEAAHNPHIKKFEDKYYLYFIAHRKEDLGLSDWMNHIFTQRIGVAIADQPEGPWTVLPEPLIDYQEGKPAHGYMVNPSVCERPDGTYLMMFKARKPGAETFGKFDPIHCVATAPTPVGPFTIADQTLLTEHTAEDPFVWYQNNRYYALVKDMYAKYTGHKSLALFESVNGLDWGPSQHILVSKTELMWEDGSVWALQNLERPQIWFNERGEPAVLFCAARLKAKQGEKPQNTFNVHIPIRVELTD